MGFWPRTWRGKLGALTMLVGISSVFYGGWRIGNRIDTISGERVALFEDVFNDRPKKKISEQELNYRNNSLYIVGLGFGISAFGAILAAYSSRVKETSRETKELPSYYAGEPRAVNKKRYEL
jgi:hypothetical protein